MRRTIRTPTLSYRYIDAAVFFDTSCLSMVTASSPHKASAYALHATVARAEANSTSNSHCGRDWTGPRMRNPSSIVSCATAEIFRRRRHSRNAASSVASTSEFRAEARRSRNRVRNRNKVRTNPSHRQARSIARAALLLREAARCMLRSRSASHPGQSIPSARQSAC